MVQWISYGPSSVDSSQAGPKSAARGLVARGSYSPVDSNRGISFVFRPLGILYVVDSTPRSVSHARVCLDDVSRDSSCVFPFRRDASMVVRVCSIKRAPNFQVRLMVLNQPLAEKLLICLSFSNPKRSDA